MAKKAFKRVRLNAADFLMGVFSSARFAQLARIGSVVRSVRPAFLGSGQPPDNLDGSNLGSLCDALHAAFGARAVRKEGLTLPVKEGFTETAAAAFGCWPMMGRARPKMGLAGQRGASAGKPSRPAGQMTSGIALENQANPDLAVLGEVVSMQVCLMACLMQQYRCRRGRHQTLPLRRLRWMVNLECINLLR
jgi:hypothetical protein